MVEMLNAKQWYQHQELKKMFSFSTDTLFEYRLEYLSSAARFNTHLPSKRTDFDSCIYLALQLQWHSIEEMAGYLFQNLMHFHFQSMPLLHSSDSFYSKFIQRLSSHRQTKLAGVCTVYLCLRQLKMSQILQDCRIFHSNMLPSVSFGIALMNFSKLSIKWQVLHQGSVARLALILD